MIMTTVTTIVISTIVNITRAISVLVIIVSTTIAITMMMVTIVSTTMAIITICITLKMTVPRWRCTAVTVFPFHVSPSNLLKFRLGTLPVSRGRRGLMKVLISILPSLVVNVVFPTLNFGTVWPSVIRPLLPVVIQM